MDCTDARQDYLRSATGFQKAAGFRDGDGGSSLRLDGACSVPASLRSLSVCVLSELLMEPCLLHVGAVVAASNAALALVQQGDDTAAIKEMQKTLRRAPGSADLRAALAALYWSQVCVPVSAVYLARRCRSLEAA